MAEKEYQEIMNLLLKKDFDELTPKELKLVNQYLEGNNILNDSFTISEIVESLQDEEQGLEVDPKSEVILSNAFNEKYEKRPSLFISLFPAIKFKHLAYSFIGVAAVLMAVFILMPENYVTNKLDDDFFIENTQFIDMDIEAYKVSSEQLMNMEFIEN